MNEVVAKAPTGSLTIPKRFAANKGVNDDLMAGVAVSFPILSIASKQWTVRWKGEERVVTLPPPHEDIAAPYVDVVILNTQKDLSRVFYKDPFGNQRNKPDCWASNGIKPDNEVPHPVNPVCATCPNAAWGSGASAIAPKAQACQQRRRTVVVPYQNDLTNEAEGGPMLLSVPPASLANQRKYGMELKDLELPDGTKDIPYYALVTRLSFEKTDQKGQPIKFPKVKFDFLKTAEGYPIFITDEQADVVDALRNGEAVKSIFNSKMNLDGGEVEGHESDGSQLKAPPKPAAAVTPKSGIPPAPAAAASPPPPPPPRPPAATAVKRDVIDTSINEAVAAPAAAPPSARAVKTAAPPLIEEAEPDAEAMANVAGVTEVFDKLMARNLE